jgi:hypothetical protein
VLVIIGLVVLVDKNVVKVLEDGIELMIVVVKVENCEGKVEKVDKKLVIIFEVN